MSKIQMLFRKTAISTDDFPMRDFNKEDNI